MLQHYFVSGIIPHATEAAHYYSKALGDERYVAGLYGTLRSIPPGAKDTFSVKMYVGPKLQATLETIAPGLVLTVDYGRFWIFAKPIFWLLSKIHDYVGNWGFAIIIVTFIMKAAFFKLSASSYRSMANMRRIQPRLKALKERYGDDRARMNEAMMKIYKEEKINPLGGCLPILIQIPVWISLYWVLLESVELRQADFIWWLNDLSSPDPRFVLPAIMGLSMYFQQKLNPTPMDPIQEKVMQIFPLIFTGFTIFFPAGLVLYWVVNNILSILQQWIITRKIEKSTQPSTA